MVARRTQQRRRDLAADLEPDRRARSAAHRVDGTSRWTAGSRTTPPRRAWARPRTAASPAPRSRRPGEPARHGRPGSASSEMNETSTTARVGLLRQGHGLGHRTGRGDARASVPSRRRGDPHGATPRAVHDPRREHRHARAPRCNRQSVNPPVDAPTSRHTRPDGSTPNASRAPASFSPPRDTNGARSTSVERASRGRPGRPGLRSVRAPSPVPTRTRPASSSAWARERVSARPWVTTSWSRRTRLRRSVPPRRDATGRCPARRWSRAPGTRARRRRGGGCGAGRPPTRGPRSGRRGSR